MKQIAGIRSNKAETPSVAHAPGGETQLQPTIPPEIQSLLDKHPVITGEDAETYDNLLAHVALEVKPTGIIEWLWVKDVVDLAWEVRRLRRLKVNLLRVARREALATILMPLLDGGSLLSDSYHTSRQLASACIEGQAAARKRVDALLQKNRLGVDAVMAQALSQKLDDIERIDRMMATAESRRDKTIREIETRRDSLARRLRQASQEVIDVEDAA